jgi:hypothetical protein
MNRLIAKAAAATMILWAAVATAAGDGLQDVTLLIIRHAEKAGAGPGLSDEGERHAEAYVKYFSKFEVNGAPVVLDGLFAAADSKKSSRPRLTLEPLARRLGLALDTRFKDKDPEWLAAALKTETHGKHLLVCWHHGEMPALLRALGADPDALLPKGKWPESQFRWVIELQYDHEGKLIPAQCRRIEQDLQY